MAAKKKNADRFKEIRNAKAFRDYAIEETFEAGIVLSGTEVKSIRGGRAQITDAFARIEKGELFLFHMHVSEYAFGNINNHNPYRPRKLLLKRREIERIAREVAAGGLSVVPIRVYFKGGLIKVEIGLGRGKKLYDKRETLKKKVHEREMDRAIKANLKQG